MAKFLLDLFGVGIAVVGDVELSGEEIDGGSDVEIGESHVVHFGPFEEDLLRLEIVEFHRAVDGVEDQAVLAHERRARVVPIYAKGVFVLQLLHNVVVVVASIVVAPVVVVVVAFVVYFIVVVVVVVVALVITFCSSNDFFLTAELTIMTID